MRSAVTLALAAGFVLTSCGTPEPAGGALPPPSDVTGSSLAPPPTEVPGNGEPDDPAARVRPELMTVTPATAAPGASLELTFPKETDRGVAYVLERAAGDTWSTTHFLTSSADGYGGTPSAVSVDSSEGYGWEDIGIGGPGPDRLVLPDDASIGLSRICTANAIENFCAEIIVIDDATPVATTPLGSAGTDTIAPQQTTAPETTTPEMTTPQTTTPETTAAPAPVPIVAVHEGVGFYPACGNETLTFDGETWYQLNHYDGYDEEYATIYEAFADAEREPSPVAGRRGFAPAVVAPGPGDDIGTLVIWADGVARWVSESGDLDVWMVDDEITYNWVC